MIRGELFRLPAAEGPDEDLGRYAIVVQADELLGLDGVLVAPASTEVRPASFRPTIELDGMPIRVLVEQTTVIDPKLLGKPLRHLDPHELRAVDEALALVLGL
jgi:mRNA interferase MazF